MSYSVFISHSMVEADAPIIAALVSRLSRKGVHSYLAERDAQPGRSLSSKIIENIHNSDLVAVVWTNGGSSSEWVNQEVGAARSAGKLVIPIVEKGVRVRGLLEGVERVEFDRSDPDAALESLESYLANLRAAKEQAEADERFRQDMLMVGVAIAVVIAFAVVLALASRK